MLPGNAQAAELGSGGGTCDLPRLFVSFRKGWKPRPEAILTVRFGNDSGGLLFMAEMTAQSFSDRSNFSRQDWRLARSLRSPGSADRDLAAGSGRIVITRGVLRSPNWHFFLGVFRAIVFGTVEFVAKL